MAARNDRPLRKQGMQMAQLLQCRERRKGKRRGLPGARVELDSEVEFRHHSQQQHERGHGARLDDNCQISQFLVRPMAAAAGTALEHSHHPIDCPHGDKIAGP